MENSLIGKVGAAPAGKRPPPKFYGLYKTKKLLNLLFKDHDALAVQMDEFAVLVDLLLKVLPELFSRKFGTGVRRLLIVGCDNERDLGVEYRYVMRDFVQCGHQIDHAREENWKHSKRRLFN